MRSPRLPALVVIAGAVAAGLVAQSGDDDRSGTVDTAAVEPGVAIPAARPEGGLSSTWYCAGGTGVADGSADHTIHIANPTGERRTATVTALGGDVAAPLSDPQQAPTTGTDATTTTTTTTTTTAPPTSLAPAPAPVARQVEVPADGRTDLRLGDVLQAPLVGAIVEVDGGGVAVEHTISGDLGTSSAACSTTAAQEWMFAWGSTERGNRELLVFMNPFPETATIDIEFVTDEGVRQTRRFDGFPVPARSVVGAYIDDDVQRKAQVSAHVRLRSGRVVIDRIQTHDGTDGRRGMTLGLGAPTPAQSWVFPDGQVSGTLGEQIVVFNPTDDVVEAQVEVRPAEVGEAGIPEPFALTVPPGRFARISLHEEERVAKDQPHSIHVRSLNGVPIVAERVIWSNDPDGRQGISAALGSPIGARRWLLAAGGTSGEVDEWVTLVNVTDEDATVTFTALADGQTIPVQDLQEVVVPAQGRLAVRLGEKIERTPLPLVITSDRHVVVERGLYRGSGIGMSNSMAIPVADDVTVLRPID